MRLMMRAAVAAAVMLAAGLPLAADSHVPHGVLVTAVDPGGPAAAAGVQSGDLIVGIDGQPVAQISDLTGALAAAEHAEVTLTIKRGDDMIDQVVAIDYVWERPRLGLMVSNVQPQHEQLGMGKELDEEMAPDGSEFHFEERMAPGAIVLEVVPESPAADAGLQPGDWITAVDGTELSEAAGQSGRGDRWLGGRRQRQPRLRARRRGDERRGDPGREPGNRLGDARPALPALALLPDARVRARRPGSGSDAGVDRAPPRTLRTDAAQLSALPAGCAPAGGGSRGKPARRHVAADPVRRPSGAATHHHGVAALHPRGCRKAAEPGVPFPHRRAPLPRCAAVLRYRLRVSRLHVPR